MHLKTEKVILGLSGNPESLTQQGLLCVGFPFYEKLSGRSDITFSQRQLLILGLILKKSSPVTRILKVIQISKMVCYISPHSNQHNGSVSSMSDCDLLLAVIPAGSKPLS